MRTSSYTIARAFLLGLTTLLTVYLLLLARNSRSGERRLQVRIFTPRAEDSRKLRNLRLDITRQNSGSYVEASVTPAQLAALRHRGYSLEVVSANERSGQIPSIYRSLEEIEAALDSLATAFPHLVRLEQIGVGSELGLPIWAAKVSDNVSVDEDEPAVLFTGVHHAREPLGAEIALALMKHLTAKYGRDAQVTRWVNNTSIWFVPVVNPEGYKYVMDNRLTFPWWRKNLRDNNGDGKFDPLVDGVDLNRNYDYNWDQGGDGYPGSWFYRGSRPFSESEIRAVRDLALRENFVFGVAYHSYGESILFPWGNYDRPPDLDVILDVATQMASRIRRVDGRGHYALLPLNGRVGQSSIWMYGELGTIDFIVEVGTDYFPPNREVPAIVSENVKGALYLLDRLNGPGITGHVFDAETGAPLNAEVRVQENSAPHVKVRRTDPRTGRYDRILLPGIYTVEFRSDGYLSRVFAGLRVPRRKPLKLDVRLKRKEDRIILGN
jgi:hypothetical protein